MLKSAFGVISGVFPAVQLAMEVVVAISGLIRHGVSIKSAKAL
ncbi:hypothetical protein [Undibacterium squillarum]|nr:hypothetical protein [Undibacterium squillarum]